MRSGLVGLISDHVQFQWLSQYHQQLDPAFLKVQMQQVLYILITGYLSLIILCKMIWI